MNRNLTGKIALGVFSLGLLALIFAGSWRLYAAAMQDYQQYKQASANERQEAAEQIAKDCTIGFEPPDVVAKCLSEKIKAYQDKEAAEQDLEAQKDMAWGALAMVALGGVGLILNVAGVSLLIMSLRQTRMAITNDRQIGQTGLRAYVSVVPTYVVSFDANTPCLMEYKVTNSGNTPASALLHGGVLGIAHIDRLDEFREPNIIVAGTGGVLSKDQTFGGKTEAARLSPEQIGQIRNGTHVIVIVVSVSYRDVFDDPYSETTAFYLAADPDTLVKLTSSYVAKDLVVGFNIIRTYKH